MPLNSYYATLHTSVYGNFRPPLRNSWAEPWMYEDFFVKMEGVSLPWRLSNYKCNKKYEITFHLVTLCR